MTPYLRPIVWSLIGLLFLTWNGLALIGLASLL